MVKGAGSTRANPLTELPPRTASIQLDSSRSLCTRQRSSDGSRCGSGPKRSPDAAGADAATADTSVTSCPSATALKRPLMVLLTTRDAQ